MRKTLTAIAVATIGVVGTAGVTHADGDDGHCDDWWDCEDEEPNFMIGTRDQDVMIGTPDIDVILGLRGNDVLIGRGGDDILRGGRGNDDLRGATPPSNSGEDILRGGVGFDRCTGDAEDTFISCEVVVVR